MTITQLTNEQLQQVIDTNELPEGCDLTGIGQRPDADKLFKHRLNPKFIAKVLLLERQSTSLGENLSVKEERLQLKRLELEIKKSKLETTSAVLDNIYKRLQ